MIWREVGGADPLRALRDIRALDPAIAELTRAMVFASVRLRARPPPPAPNAISDPVHLACDNDSACESGSESGSTSESVRGSNRDCASGGNQGRSSSSASSFLSTEESFEPVPRCPFELYFTLLCEYPDLRRYIKHLTLSGVVSITSPWPAGHAALLEGTLLAFSQMLINLESLVIDGCFWDEDHPRPTAFDAVAHVRHLSITRATVYGVLPFPLNATGYFSRLTSFTLSLAPAFCLEDECLDLLRGATIPITSLTLPPSIPLYAEFLRLLINAVCGTLTFLSISIHSFSCVPSYALADLVKLGSIVNLDDLVVRFPLLCMPIQLRRASREDEHENLAWDYSADLVTSAPASLREVRVILDAGHFDQLWVMDRFWSIPPAPMMKAAQQHPAAPSLTFDLLVSASSPMPSWRQLCDAFPAWKTADDDEATSLSVSRSVSDRSEFMDALPFFSSNNDYPEPDLEPDWDYSAAYYDDEDVDPEAS